MPDLKTGIVVVTTIVKHICRVLTKSRNKINSVIDDAVTAGAITSTQAGILKGWLDGAQVSCDILRLITGY